MRAVVHHTFGEPVDVLGVEERPLPEPGPGQVRVRTLLAAIHNHDLWTVRGTYGFKPDLPARAGTEAVGVVDALGDGVTGLSVGQRVTGMAFGAWAEHFVAAAAGLVPVPDAIPDEQAAQLVAMPFSAISLLESLDLESGDVLVQNAANGAVGRMLVQLARPRGVRVVGLVRREEAVAELAAQGINGVVATDGEGWRARARELAGRDARAGVDSVGGRSAGDVLSLLGEGGTLVVFGAMASPTVELPSGALIFKQAVVKGFWGSTVSATMPAETRTRLFRELIGRVLAGELTLPVAAVHRFEDVRTAADATLTAGRVGKVLLRP